jgi:hypothetical protein
MELPSPSAPKTCTRFCMVSLFILTIMLERLRIVKGEIQKKLKIYLSPKELSGGNVPLPTIFHCLGSFCSTLGALGKYGSIRRSILSKDCCAGLILFRFFIINPPNKSINAML